MLGDKRILITGGASGMGREIAIEAARQGAKNVGIADINLDGLEVTADQVRAEGADASVIKVDLRSGDQIRAMVDGFAAYAGGLDVLVNNAGVLDHLFTPADQVSVDKLDEAVWDIVNDINLKAVWLATKYAAPYLLNSDRGPSVTTAINLGPHVRANSYSPGSIKTPMSDSHLARAADKLATARAMYGTHLIPRRGRVEEIARTVCFLASDDASFITGVNLPVDGGTTAWRGMRDVELDD